MLWQWLRAGSEQAALFGAKKATWLGRGREDERERERNDLFKALEFLQIPEELELPAVLHTQTKQQRLKIVSVHRDPYWHLSTSPALLLSPLLPLPLLPPPVLAPAPAPA